MGTNYTKVKPDIGGAKPSDLRAKFETLVSLQKKKNQNNLAIFFMTSVIYLLKNKTLLSNLLKNHCVGLFIKLVNNLYKQETVVEFLLDTF